jgi:Protein of unknown function (DUF3619)
MMNSQYNRAEILQDRFALKATAYLSAGSANLPHDITERLRAGRAQAVAKRKISILRTAGSVNVSGGSASLTWGGTDSMGWWGWAGSVIPLVALVVGMFVIDSVQSDQRVMEIAEVDSALLVDDLPPAAFSDPGFVQFLKSNRGIQ